MRQLTYFVACSVDGFIAHHDGSHGGFLQAGEHLTDIIQTFPETIPGHLRSPLGVDAENQCFDTVLMGRKTYEVGLKIGITSPYPHLNQVLVSQSMGKSPDASVELVSSDAAAQVKRLKQEVGKGIWLCGGATLAAHLFAENLIDKLVLKVNPFLMGSGIPLFSEPIQQSDLELLDSKRYRNGVLLLDYQVQHDAA